MILGIILRTLFSRDYELYDDNTSPFFGFNFTTFGKTLFSTSLIAINGGGTGEIMMGFYNVDWLKFTFWFGLFIIVKFLLGNFLIGAMIGEYMNLYNIEIEYVKKYPKFTKALKTLIHQERYNNKSAYDLVYNYVNKKTDTNKADALENFYLGTTDPDFNTIIYDNKDSMFQLF